MADLTLRALPNCGHGIKTIGGSPASVHQMAGLGRRKRTAGALSGTTLTGHPSHSPTPPTRLNFHVGVHFSSSSTLLPLSHSEHRVGTPCAKHHSICDFFGFFLLLSAGLQGRRLGSIVLYPDYEPKQATRTGSPVTLLRTTRNRTRSQRGIPSRSRSQHGISDSPTVRL